MLDYRDCIIVDDPSIRAKAHMARLEKAGGLLSDAGQALTLCDVCAKAAGGMGGCSWSRKGEQRPVPGWEAVRRDIPSGVCNELMAVSYVVLRCPAFIADKHRQAEFRQFDPERARRRALRNGGADGVSGIKIGLVAADGHNGFPNLALMRLSAYHKERGDEVDWWNGFTHYDRVYISKVFTFTPDFDTFINADEIITGGTGYRDYRNLPPEVEHADPDYSIYPNFRQAIGFLTRGCIRRCPWCIVPRKEGNVRPAAAWDEIKRPDSREIIFLDNNVLASGHGLEQIERMGGEQVWVDFNQGLDARLITPDIARLLARLHWIRFIRLACDTSEMLPAIEQAAAYLRDAGAAPSRFWAYALVQDVEEAHRRVLALRDMGVEPFAQPYRDYNGGEPTEEQRAFAHWVNKKSVFRACTWEEFRYNTSGKCTRTQTE